MVVKMLFHIEDGAILNAIINDQGNMLIFCPSCKKIWVGNLNLVNHSTSHKETWQRQYVDSDVSKIIRSVLNSNPRMLDSIGLTSSIISELDL